VHLLVVHVSVKAQINCVYSQLQMSITARNLRHQDHQTCTAWIYHTHSEMVSSCQSAWE